MHLSIRFNEWWFVIPASASRFGKWNPDLRNSPFHKWLEEAPLHFRQTKRNRKWGWIPLRSIRMSFHVQKQYFNKQANEPVLRSSLSWNTAHFKSHTWEKGSFMIIPQGNSSTCSMPQLAAIHPLCCQCSHQPDYGIAIPKLSCLVSCCLNSSDLTSFLGVPACILSRNQTTVVSLLGMCTDGIIPLSHDLFSNFTEKKCWCMPATRDYFPVNHTIPWIGLAAPVEISL